jgi:hypothetical protein
VDCEQPHAMDTLEKAGIDRCGLLDEEASESRTSLNALHYQPAWDTVFVSIASRNVSVLAWAAAPLARRVLVAHVSCDMWASCLTKSGTLPPRLPRCLTMRASGPEVRAKAACPRVEGRSCLQTDAEMS